MQKSVHFSCLVVFLVIMSFSYCSFCKILDKRACRCRRNYKALSYHLCRISQHAIVFGKTPRGLKSTDIENILQSPIRPQGLHKFCCQWRANKMINSEIWCILQPVKSISIYRYFFSLSKVFPSCLAIVISQKRHRQISSKIVQLLFISFPTINLAFILRHNLWGFWKCSTLNEILVFSIKLVSKVS